MDDQPHRDRKSSISGNSGTLGVQKPKIQPVRITTLLASCGSDYDSEDRERDSEEEDETDDCSPSLPENPIILSADDDKDFERLNPIAEATLEVSPSNVVCSNELLGDPGKCKLTEVKENLFFPENPILFNKYTDDKVIKINLDSSNTEGLKVYSAPPVRNKEKTFTNSLAALSIASESVKRSKSHSPDPKFETSLLKEQEYRANESRVRQSGIYYESRDRKIYKSNHTGLEEFSINPKKIFSSDNKPQAEPSNRGNEYLQVQRNFPTEVATATSSASSAPSSNANGPFYLVTDTPLKHTQPIGSTRPTPCHSHKTLFGSSQNQITPKNKIESDFQKNVIQTPASIVPPWPESSRLCHTPLPSQVVHSTGNPHLTSSSSKHDLQRFVTFFFFFFFFFFFSCIYSCLF